MLFKRFSSKRKRAGRADSGEHTCVHLYKLYTNNLECNQKLKLTKADVARQYKRVNQRHPERYANSAN